MGSSTSSDKSPWCSVVIPLYNEEGSVAELDRRLRTVMEGLGRPYEILYVDDGSTDTTPRILARIEEEDPRVRVITFSRNFGQHPAVYAGFDRVRGSVVITLDGDLQNPPEEIPKLLEKLEEGFDVVAGVRAVRHDSILRTIPSRFVNWMVGKLTRVPLRDYGCLLRAYRRPVIETLRRCREQTVYFTALVSWLGVRIAEVEVNHAPRAAGRSKYNWLKLITMNFDLLTGYSILPIQLISICGILLAALGFLLALLFLGIGFLRPSNLTWVLLGLSAFFSFFGLQLVALGFIGEYIGRVLIEVKQRPYYLLKEELAAPEEGG
ncbi:MAG: glycosyltransferase [Planctomycetota bacterium]